MGRPGAAPGSLPRQEGRCSLNSDRSRRPLARASTRYSGRSADSGGAEVLLAPGGSVADEELAERRGMMAFLLGGRSVLSLRVASADPGQRILDRRATG